MFAKRLSLLRKGAGITQEQLAKELGTSRGALSMYEIGRREPDFNTLVRIARYFSVTVDYLVGLSDQPHGHGRQPVIFRELSQLTEDEMEYVRETLQVYRRLKRKQKKSQEG